MTGQQRDAVDVAAWWLGERAIEVACGICPAGILGWNLLADRSDDVARLVLWRYLATHLAIAHSVRISDDLPIVEISTSAQREGPCWRDVDTWRHNTQKRKEQSFASLKQWSDAHPDLPRLDIAGL